MTSISKSLGFRRTKPFQHSHRQYRTPRNPKNIVVSELLFVNPADRPAFQERLTVIRLENKSLIEKDLGFPTTQIKKRFQTDYLKFADHKLYLASLSLPETLPINLSQEVNNCIYQCKDTQEYEFILMDPEDPCKQRFYEFIHTEILSNKQNADNTNRYANPHSDFLFSVPLADLAQVKKDYKKYTEFANLPKSSQFKNIIIPKDLANDLRNKVYFLARYTTLSYVPLKEEREKKVLNLNLKAFHPLLRKMRLAEHVFGLASPQEPNRVRRGKILKELYNLSYDTPLTLFKVIYDSILSKPPFKLGLSEKGLELQYLEILSDEILSTETETPDKDIKHKSIKTTSNLRDLARSCLFFYDSQSKNKNDNPQDIIPCRLVPFIFRVPYISANFLRNLFDYKSEKNETKFFEYERNFYKSTGLQEIDLVNKINSNWEEQVRLSEQYMKVLKEAPNCRDYEFYEKLIAIENNLKAESIPYQPLEDIAKENTDFKFQLISQYIEFKETKAFKKFMDDIEKTLSYFVFFETRYSNENSSDKEERIKKEANMIFDAGAELTGELILSSQLELVTFYPSDRLNKESRNYLEYILKSQDSEIGESSQAS